MRPPEALRLDRAPEFCPEPKVSPEHRVVNNATPIGLPTALYSNTVRSALFKEPAQCPGGHQHHFLRRDKMADDRVDRDVHSPWHINFKSKRAATKDRHYDLGLPINMFPVLPPVPPRTPHLKSQRVTQQVSFGESVAGRSSEAGSVEPWSASESRGVARTEEVSVTRPPRPSRDTYRAVGPPTAMYNPPSQENQQPLTMFTVHDLPLSDIGDTAHHRTSISVDKHWKQMVSDDRRHARSTAPQLPILFGTKLPILSGQRKTYLNTPFLCSHTP